MDKTQKSKSRLSLAGAVAFTMLMMSQANAQALDVSGVTTAITDNVASLNTVAVAVIGVLVIVMVVNMIRRLIR